jgi:Kef-type K+ transport system membrane component KefB
MKPLTLDPSAAAASTASASSALHTSAVHQSEALLYFVLLQLVVIVLAGRLGGALAKRLGQSSAVGEIVIGILLGPSLFGLLMPDLFQYVFRSVPSAPLSILSQIGLILLMFQIGLEFDFSHLTEQRNRKAVWGIAAAGMVAPFALGFGAGYWVAPILSPGVNQLASALFVATAFSITALPILGRIMMEFKLTRTPIGVIAISAAAINDVIGWLLLALITTITVSQFEPTAFGIKVALVGAFFAASWFGVRPALKRLVRHCREGDDALPPMLMGGLLAAIFIGAMTTYQLGIFAIFGGFMMGVILHDEVDMIKAWNLKIGAFVQVFFLPIFFTYTGLRTQVGSLDSMGAWGWCALLIALATLGKFGGCYLAARWAGMSHNEGKVIGIMMNTRALMELIVLNVGLDLGVISPTMFTMLVLMAIVSTVVTTPGLLAWLPAIGLWPAKAQRQGGVTPPDDATTREAA